jgi:xylan 1,4-beta-xylosidase
MKGISLFMACFINCRLFGRRADWQQQPAMTKRERGFRHIRFYGILSDDMGVYQEDSHGQPVYNWQYTDQLYDFLPRIKVKPFVELSFMPNALKSMEQTIFWWRGNVSQPASYDKWTELIKQMVMRQEQRYGRKEIASWYFEVWNEPNLSQFFAGAQSDYFNLYQTNIPLTIQLKAGEIGAARLTTSKETLNKKFILNHAN